MPFRPHLGEDSWGRPNERPTTDDRSERLEAMPHGGEDEYVWRCGMCGRTRDAVPMCAVCGDALDAMDEAA